MAPQPRTRLGAEREHGLHGAARAVGAGPLPVLRHRKEHHGGGGLAVIAQRDGARGGQRDEQVDVDDASAQRERSAQRAARQAQRDASQRDVLEVLQPGHPRGPRQVVQQRHRQQ